MRDEIHAQDDERFVRNVNVMLSVNQLSDLRPTIFYTHRFDALRRAVHMTISTLPLSSRPLMRMVSRVPKSAFTAREPTVQTLQADNQQHLTPKWTYEKQSGDIPLPFCTYRIKTLHANHLHLRKQSLLIRSHVVIHNLDVDSANGISHESAIVPRVILRPGTRRAVVFAAGFDGSFVELVDELVVCGLPLAPSRHSQ